MADETTTIATLKVKVADFVRARDWEKFQRPAIVPYDSFVTGIVILTPFFLREATSFSMSFVMNMNPVFPFSGGESGHKWIRTLDPLGDTVCQCGYRSTIRNPSLS